MHPGQARSRATRPGPVDPRHAVRTGHAFLDDIAHHAVPARTTTTRPTPGTSGRTPDVDTDDDDGDRGTYDDELLDPHFVAGDGRVNENIGLTAVHHVFHSEHNRLAGDINDVINTTEHRGAGRLELGGPAWDYGERLFQAARFVTEMEYQHLAFEEFARKVQPMVNLFGEGAPATTPTINPAIRAEFAHAVYRFGHSMLTETVARTNADNATTTSSCSTRSSTRRCSSTAAAGVPRTQAAGSIVRGMTRQVGNEIDEFVTEALRNDLLGLPLDLATINMARARDTGIPPLNAARRAFFAETRQLRAEAVRELGRLRLRLKHRESLVNFIAAYGTHDSITGRDHRGKPSRCGAGTVRPAAADPVDDAGLAAKEDSVRFHQQPRRLGQRRGRRDHDGFDVIDLWVGGLAEKQMVFGGLLGPTFNFVFETQMEDLQDGDRFYYLYRTAGLNLLTQLEGNSFAELIQRNTDVRACRPTRSRGPTSSSTWRARDHGPILDDPATEVQRVDAAHPESGRHHPLQRPGARRVQRHRRATTRSGPARVTTPSAATTATTAWRAARATTTSSAASATTSCPTLRRRRPQGRRRQRRALLRPGLRGT